jgi:hypothetical protein
MRCGRSYVGMVGETYRYRGKGKKDIADIDEGGVEG